MEEGQDYETGHGSRMPGPRGQPFEDGLSDRSTAELLKEFVGEGQLLLKEELRLAKLEAKEEARKAVKAGTGFGAAAVLLNTGLLAFAGFLIAVGALFLPVWASALIVTALFLAIGGIAALYAKKKANQLEPARPAQGLKEEREWLSDTMRSVRSHRHGNA